MKILFDALNKKIKLKIYFLNLLMVSILVNCDSFFDKFIKSNNIFFDKNFSFIIFIKKNTISFLINFFIYILLLINSIIFNENF